MNTEKLSEIQSNFSVALYKVLAAENAGENVFFSPISISIALAMTYAGSDGESKKQMEQALFPGLQGDEDVHKNFSSLIDVLNEKTAAYKLHTANRLYANSGFKVLEEFANILAKHYKSQFQQVDFVKKAEEARQEINKWVEDVTNKKIANLLAPGILDANTRLVLINAVYFKGDWEHKFKEKATQKKPFFLLDGKEIQVDMMHQVENFHYADLEENQILGLPYVEGHLSMFIILPKDKKNGLTKLEENLTGEKLLKMIRATNRRKVDVEIPKFKMEQQFGLNDALQKLGVTDIFNQRANFQKISKEEKLFVSAVIHKAFIEVNEKGTEAAAATGIVMTFGCAIPTETEKPPKFVADHSFCFVLWDTRKDVPIFFGRTLKP